MSIKCIAAGVFLAITLHAGQARAATCLNGGCHQDLIAKRYVHGPVAAEQIGARGCVACHVPAGPACDKSRPGKFKPLLPVDRMCRMCHASGTGTKHSTRKTDCLKCHDPHGSSASPTLNR